MENTITIEQAEAETTAPAVSAPCRLIAALVKAQAGFARVVKNKVNPAFKSRYADIEAILAAVRPALNANGIFVYQHVTNRPGEVSCETVLMHDSGERLAGGSITVPLGKSSNAAQALGSAITYARRYSLSATLGISADDDDDGNACAADPAPAPALVASHALKAKAEEAAKAGVAAYQGFWKNLPNADRKTLSESGIHNAMKALANEASHE